MQMMEMEITVSAHLRNIGGTDYKCVEGIIKILHLIFERNKS